MADIQYPATGIGILSVLVFFWQETQMFFGKKPKYLLYVTDPLVNLELLIWFFIVLFLL